MKTRNIPDRKSDVLGKGVDLGGRRNIKKLYMELTTMPMETDTKETLMKNGKNLGKVHYILQMEKN